MTRTVTVTRTGYYVQWRRPTGESVPVVAPLIFQDRRTAARWARSCHCFARRGFTFRVRRDR